MSNIEWMLSQMESQIKGVKKQISGLPEEYRKEAIQRAIDILSEKEKKNGSNLHL